MRLLHIIGFLLGLAAFLTSAYFTGRQLGDTFWKVGIAIMMSDIVLMLLCPSPKRN
jgi:hypothetical protein